ncbi:MAG: histidine kinase, partial [Nitrospiraceae bacterium]|nr:histidine kinase [Nitrospiraceae bacterium]
DVLAAYVERWREQSGIAASFEFAPHVVPAPQQELQLVRIVQEGLANVRKHSRAKHVQITIAALGSIASGVRLSIEDDGIGFIPRRSGGASFPASASRR